MSTTTTRGARTGDARLLRACLILDRLGEERVPAPARLELELGAAEARRLVAALSRRARPPARERLHGLEAA